jgi:HD superfamily phosphohydrolase
MRRALQVYSEGRSVWIAEQTPFEKILKCQRLTTLEHLEIDDSDFVFHVKQWQRSDDKILSDLSRRFIHRRLFKAINLDLPQEARMEFLHQAREVVQNAGYDSDYYFIEDRASDVPYYNYYSAEKAEPKTHIYVQTGYATPKIREISEVSNAVRGLQHGYELHRVCFPEEVKDLVYALYHKTGLQIDSVAAG